MIARSGIIGFALALLILPVGLVTPAHAVSKNVLNLPTWTVGDFWDYTVAVSIPDATGGPSHNGTGTATMRVSATEKLVQGSTVYDTYKLTTRSSILIDRFVAVNFTLTGWYQKADLSLVKSVVNFTFFGIEVASDEAYSPPQLMRWPVTSGASWTSDSNVTIDAPAFQVHYVQPASTMIRADEPQKVTVAAGTFSTSPLEKTLVINGTGIPRGISFSYYANEMGLLVWRNLSVDNSVTRIQGFWSNDVGAPVRQLITGDLGFTGSSELRSFRYQAATGCGDHNGQNQLGSQTHVAVIILGSVAELLQILPTERLQGCGTIND